jgi:hypothetical protein
MYFLQVCVSGIAAVVIVGVSGQYPGSSMACTTTPARAANGAPSNPHIDYEHAKPMPLPTAHALPDKGLLFEQPERDQIVAPPVHSPGATGSGEKHPQALVPPG